MFSEFFEQYIVESMPLFFRRWYYTRVWGKNISADLLILSNPNKIKRRVNVLSDEELDTYIRL